MQTQRAPGRAASRIRSASSRVRRLSTPLALCTGYRRDERMRARGQDELVERQPLAVAQLHRTPREVQPRHFDAMPQTDSLLRIPAFGMDGERGPLYLSRQIARQVDAKIGEPHFPGEERDPGLRRGGA